MGIEPYAPDVYIPEPLRQPQEQLSLTGRSTVPVGDYDRSHIAPILASQSFGNARVVHNGNHNQVVIGRIQAGVDVRTTVCSSASLLSQHADK